MYPHESIDGVEVSVVGNEAGSGLHGVGRDSDIVRRNRAPFGPQRGRDACMAVHGGEGHCRNRNARVRCDDRLPDSFSDVPACRRTAPSSATLRTASPAPAATLWHRARRWAMVSTDGVGGLGPGPFPPCAVRPSAAMASMSASNARSLCAPRAFTALVGRRRRDACAVDRRCCRTPVPRHRHEHLTLVQHAHEPRSVAPPHETIREYSAWTHCAPGKRSTSFAVSRLRKASRTNPMSRCAVHVDDLFLAEQVGAPQWATGALAGAAVGGALPAPSAPRSVGACTGTLWSRLIRASRLRAPSAAPT